MKSSQELQQIADATEGSWYSEDLREVIMDELEEVFDATRTKLENVQAAHRALRSIRSKLETVETQMFDEYMKIISKPA